MLGEKGKKIERKNEEEYKEIRIYRRDKVFPGVKKIKKRKKKTRFLITSFFLGLFWLVFYSKKNVKYIYLKILIFY